MVTHWGPSRRFRIWVAGGLIASALGILGLWYAASSTGLPTLGVGSAAPGFSLPSLNGRMISLSRLRGRAILINFWAAWCPYCRAEATSLSSLESSCRRLTVLGVAVGAREAGVAAFANQMGIGYPELIDRNAAVAIRYGATFLPTSVLVSPNGRIAWIDRGQFLSAGQARSLVDQRLGGVCLPGRPAHG